MRDWREKSQKMISVQSSNQGKWSNSICQKKIWISEKWRHLPDTSELSDSRNILIQLAKSPTRSMEKKCQKLNNQPKSFDFSLLLSILPSTNAVQSFVKNPRAIWGFYYAGGWDYEILIRRTLPSRVHSMFPLCWSVGISQCTIEMIFPSNLRSDSAICLFSV